MTPLPLQSGAIVQSVTPHTFGPGEYGALRNSGAQGPITVHGIQPSGPDNYFRLNDGSSDLLFDGPTFTGLWRVWVTAAQRATFRNCHFHHSRMEGIILGACTDAVIEDCLAEYCGPQYLGGYSDDRHHEPSADHAYYISYGGKGNILRRCIGQHVSGCGLHTYGNGDAGEYQRGFTGEDLAFLYCGSEGTPCCQPDGTEDSSLKNVLIAHSPIGGFTWGNGDGMPCRRWVIDGLTMWNPDAKFNIHVAPGTSGITYRNSIFVLADAPLCESTEGGDFEWPVFENCLFFSDYRSGGPSDLLAGNRLRPLSEAAALFPRALKGDFAPTDPGVPGFRDWRNAPAPTPQPAPTPTPPPPPNPLAQIRAALAELDEPLAAAQHHAANVKPKDLRAALKADLDALAKARDGARAAVPKEG